MPMFEKRQRDLAIADYTDAIRISRYASITIVAVPPSEGGHNRAIADLAEAIRIKPDYADACQNRG